MRIGSRLELEFQHSDNSFPVTIEEAIVRSIADGAIGLRFTKLHRSDERRIRHSSMSGCLNSYTRSSAVPPILSP